MSLEISRDCWGVLPMDVWEKIEFPRQIVTESNPSLQRSKDHVNDLIPGVSDELTLKYIVPRLPGKSVARLSTLSRSWHRAISRREEHNARVDAQSTETLIAHHHHHEDIGAVVPCRPREDPCFERPATPLLAKTILRTGPEWVPDPSGGESSTAQKVSVCPSDPPGGTLLLEGNLLFERDGVRALLQVIHRHSYAAYIGHYPLLAFFAVSKNESIDRERYNLLQKMFLPCDPLPETEED